jgi:hypothetical protein
LSGLSLAFILDQTDMYGDVSGELQTFWLVNYVNPQSSQARENDLFVNIHGHTAA